MIEAKTIRGPARWGIALPLLLLLSMTVVLTNVFPFRQILAQQHQVELASDRLAILEQETARLEIEAEALRSPTEIERIAREDFGLVREGDTSYVVVEPPGSDPASAEPESATQLESASFWDSIWNFLTGKDLVEG